MVIAAGLLTGTALVGPAVTAQAGSGSGLSECAEGRLCLWGNNDYVWMIHHRQTAGDASSRTYNVTGDPDGVIGNVDNEMDSWANTGKHDTRGWSETDGRGRCQTFAAGSHDENVAFWNSDKISSTRADKGC